MIMVTQVQTVHLVRMVQTARTDLVDSLGDVDKTVSLDYLATLDHLALM